SVLGAVDAAGDRQIGGDPAVQDRDPPKRQPQLPCLGEYQTGDDGERFEIEVWLIKAIEEDQAVGAAGGQAGRHVRRRAEVGGELHRDRDRNAVANVAQHVQVHLLDVGAPQADAGGDVVDVQLDGVGAGLLDQSGVVDPAPGRDAVQAADDRDVGALARFGDAVQVVVRANPVA